MRVERLPQLPREALRRLQLVREQGLVTLERQILEAYAGFLAVNDRGGLCVLDLSGPGSFHTTVEGLRPRIEECYRVSSMKFGIAKRLAAHPEQSREKGLELVQRALEELEEAQHASRAYRLMERLWARCVLRVRGTLDEENFRKRLTPEDVGKLTSYPGKKPSAPDARGAAGSGASRFRHAPRFGLYEPLPVDAVGLLERQPDLIPEVHNTEALYVEMHDLCQKGQLCIKHCLVFEEKMNHEKTLIKKAMPGWQRISSAAVYNRVVNHWDVSAAHEDLEAHKFWMLTHSGHFYNPSGLRCVPTNVGKLLAIPPPPEPGEAEDLAMAATASLEGPEPQAGAGGGGEPAAEQETSSSPVCDNEDDIGEELVGVCVSCICRPAVHVLRECGHLVYCPSCRRKVVAQQLRRVGGGKSRILKPSQLRTKELERTRVRCPICREEGVLVAREKFAGTLYTV